TDEPAVLAGAAREHLREKFLRARMAVSGANFAVADSGTLVVVESEGNGRMCLTLPEVLVSVVGIEKLVPTWADRAVFLQLLPRSSTGERMNPYTSMWTGVTPGDGPQEVHVVLLDNGRTNVLADEVGRQALRCIRCSACLNACPVYERTGGRVGLSRPDRGDPHAVAARCRPRCPGRLAAVRVVVVRAVLRGVPGSDRPPVGARAPAGEGRRRPPGRAAQGAGFRDARRSTPLCRRAAARVCGQGRLGPEPVRLGGRHPAGSGGGAGG